MVDVLFASGTLLAQLTVPDIQPAPKIDGSMPWWGQVIGWCAIAVISVLCQLVLRRSDLTRIKAETDAKIQSVKAQSEAKSDGEDKAAQTSGWERLLDERRRSHERDVKRLERDLKLVHDRLTDAEQRLVECAASEERCKEEQSRLEDRIKSLETKVGRPQ